MAKGRTRREKITESSIPGYNEMAYSLPSNRDDGLRAIHPANESQRIAIELLRKKTLTVLTGPPGTAKTLLSVFVACEKLQKREIEKIYYVKPIVETWGEKGIGFLPGSEMEKLEPHLASLRDALGVFMAKGKADYLIDKKIIEFLPIDTLRGRSLHRCAIIADEMQNTTVKSLLTVLTRLGENSTIALLGDVVQRDLAGRYGEDGLTDILRRLSSMEEYMGHLEFGVEDVTRSDFVRKVILAYLDLYEKS